MKNRAVFFLSVLTAVFIATVSFYALFTNLEAKRIDSGKQNDGQSNGNVEKPISAPAPKRFLIEGVPYINEAPDGIWTGPWKNACEEASIAMVEFYYEGRPMVTVSEAKTYMSKLFETEGFLFGSNTNTDAERTARLIMGYTSFGANIVRYPTVEQIKKEILNSRPVISLHRGFILQNKNIPFLSTGSSYHMIVVIGFDDDAREFITHDDGDSKEGENYRYGYDIFMKSLHDYNYNTQNTDGPPTVIFTYPRVK